MTGSLQTPPTSPRIGLLWRGERTQPPPAGGTTRLRAIFHALADEGAEAIPVVFSDAAADEVREELLTLDGVLVWVDPLMAGVNRAVLDAVLRDVAGCGVYVSAHPDVILAMGTKDVLYRTRHLSWGTDVRLYATSTELRDQLPLALDGGARVLKQHRGNGGNGVWRVEWAPAGDASTTRHVNVLHGLRGSAVEEMSLEQLLNRCQPYFEDGGCLIDQAYQSRLADGMVRCYMAEDSVAGFGHQMVTALLADNEPGVEPPPPPPRLYYGPDKPEFQGLARQMTTDWLPNLLHTVGLDASRLPAIWDADFLYGPNSSTGSETYVLCEINISSVFPIPDEAAAPLARAAVKRALAAAERRANQP